MAFLPNDSKKRLNIQLKEEYKKILEKKAAEMTLELEEQVTITKSSIL